MNNNKKNIESLKDKVLIYLFIFISISLVFLIATWLISFGVFNSPANISSFINIHSKDKSLYLIELFPIAVFILGYFTFKAIEKYQKNIIKDVKSLNDLVENNIKIAEQIGKGTIDLQEKDIDFSDKLTVALWQMHKNIQSSQSKESELNWITRGKESISVILNRYTSIDTLAYHTLVELIKYTEMIQGAFYIYDENKKALINIATYAYNRKKYINQSFKIGEGLIGAAAFEQEMIYRKEIPSDYMTISSGILGDKKPQTLLIVPLLGDEKIQGVIEITSIKKELPQIVLSFYNEINRIIGQTLFNLKANSRTEQLLTEARNMTEELRKNEEELKRNASDMQQTQKELQKTNIDLGAQIEKVENAQKRLNALLENASEVISIYDEFGVVKYESPSVKNILGYNPEEIIGKNAFNNNTILKEKITKKAFYELLNNINQVKTFEFQYQNNENEQLWLETTARNLVEDSSINGILFNTRDITVRKIAEKAQRFSGQMAALSENSPDMIMRISPEGKFYYVNPVVHIYTGLPKEDFLDKRLEQIPISKEIIKFFRKVLNELNKTHQKYNSEIFFPAKFGERIVQFNAIPEFNEQKVLESVLIIGNDVTERKQIELEIEKKNKNITESINYAYRIQSAILPSNRIVREYLPKSFIFYQPRDVVSGDFPWFFAKGDDIFYAAVDCTGHGVPGALLSLIGYFLLENIVDHDSSMTAGQILDQLHTGVRRTLKQDTDKAKGRDGMDIALCKINTKKMQLQFAGAHRPLYLYANDELKIYKGNSKAIGGIPDTKRAEKDFVNHVIRIKENERIFFFSDGLPDQIGGSKGRKYQAIRIREHIVKQKEKSMEDMASFFVKDFNDWKQENKQIDDVLLIGIEF